MSALAFTWIPGDDLEETNSPTVLEAQFGDGYLQTSANGINNNPRSWSLRFEFRPLFEFTAMRQFLQQRGGWDYFWWLNWQDGQLVRVRCKDFKPTLSSPCFYSMTATFTEQFDLPAINSIYDNNRMVGV